MREHNAGLDRRVQKTRKLLHEALGSLINEKPYDTIALQEILDRANVGRSTFYTHFRNKDELLTESIHEMLGSIRSAALPHSGKWRERMTSFSLPIFEHHAHHMRTREARMGAKARAILHERLQKVVTALISDVLEREASNNRKPVSPIPAQLLAEYLASTFVLVLNWWVENRKPFTAEKINEFFLALVFPTLSTMRL